MLQNVSSRISLCLHEAAKSREHAERETDPAIRRDLSTAPPARPKSQHGANDMDGATKSVHNGRIAIVDDAQCVREGLQALVLSFGHRCEAFETAEEYLRSGLNGHTACLILDVQLPGMSGPDLQAHLIANGDCKPTVFVTGRFDERVRARVLAAGAFGYLTKPVDDDALFNCIETALSTGR